jgi:hypothetical protein
MTFLSPHTIRRAFAVAEIGVGLFLLMVFAIESATNSPSSKSTPILNVILLLFGIGPLALGIYELVLPPVLLKVTQSGIMLYGASVRTNEYCRPLVEDLFIPWERVASIYFLDPQQVRAAGLAFMRSRADSGRPLVVLRILKDSGWPPPSSLRPPSRLTRNARADEIYLDASYATLNGQRLCRTLEELRLSCMRSPIQR